MGDAINPDNDDLTIPDFLLRSPDHAVPAPAAPAAADNPTDTSTSTETSTPTATGWRAHLKIHPAAELLPRMSPDELRELAEDIDKNGLREQIKIYRDPVLGDCVLDGINRLDALELRGEDTRLSVFNSQELVGAHYDPTFDPYAYAISVNIKRRHLTAEKRREVIAAMLKAKPEASNRQIAAQVKADDKTVAKVRSALEATADIPQLNKTVGKDGKARKQPAKRPKAQEQPDGGVRQPAKKPRRTQDKLLVDRLLNVACVIETTTSGLVELKLPVTLSAGDLARVVGDLRAAEGHLREFRERIEAATGAS
jgi:hypothetical protein